MRKNERWLLDLLYELSHCECLAGAGNTLERLGPVSIQIPLIELIHSLPLIPC